MNIKICSNISKYRKENGVTQAELAEYLGVSPQAVSKWEQEVSIPDVYLIPEIAFFFSISIDTLFGTSDLETADLLVSKYSIIHNDKNYKEAKDSIDTLLEMNSENLKALALLCRLEYQRSHEFLIKSKEACEKLQMLSSEKDGSWEKRAAIQLMRTNAMLGNYEFIDVYKRKFEESKTIDNFINLIIAKSLGSSQQYEEVLRIVDTYINLFCQEDQQKVYPILMDLAYSLGNIVYVQKCFDAITVAGNTTPQIFNAWWLLWKTYNKVGNYKEAEKCKIELLKQLPSQNYNEYVYEEIRKHLEGQGDKPDTIF
ncbi:MAG TPA: helix-turn-helix transcriptional regulator [Lachnospiraceae bacterium]|nr:helix-turn-helix transcriptional regulator [Lachnospiraceae bacterium]